MIKNLYSFFIFINVFFKRVTFLPEKANAFPIYAQQAYENPREANGRIVCANCHLAQKPTQYENPQAVLPDSVLNPLLVFLMILLKNKF